MAGVQKRDTTFIRKLGLDLGSDLARLKYPNPEHKNAGMVFSIDGKTPGHKTLAEIKASVFHYNASAEVEGVYP